MKHLVRILIITSDPHFNPELSISSVSARHRLSENDRRLFYKDFHQFDQAVKMNNELGGGMNGSFWWVVRSIIYSRLY